MAVNSPHRADAAELNKFLEVLCLTLQQGKALQKRFSAACPEISAKGEDRWDIPHTHIYIYILFAK